MFEFAVGVFAIAVLLIVGALIIGFIENGGCGCLLFIIIATILAYNFGDWILSLLGN